MLTLDEVRQIIGRLSLENGVSNDDLMEDITEDISCIVYRIDVLEGGGSDLIARHVDIEYCFGKYYEISEDTPLFQYIGTLCELQPLQEEQENHLDSFDEYLQMLILMLCLPSAKESDKINTTQIISEQFFGKELTYGDQENTSGRHIAAL